MLRSEAVDGARRSWAPFVRRKSPGAAGAEGATRRRTFRRRLGTALVALGLLALAYGAAVYFWHDPVTDVYARWKQHGLAQQLERSFATFGGTTAPVGPTEAESRAALEGQVRADARRFAATIRPGDPLGRLEIPRLGIDPVFVNGTEWGRDLTRGPGLYPQTALPGLGRVTAIAGHRTTFGAWFRHIDRLRAGDRITVRMPYATFVYTVGGHRIVENDDWRIIRPRPRETLVLSACHPLYSASHRWVVFATLVRVESPHGTYEPA